MTDEERKRIAEEARAESRWQARVENLEVDMKSVKGTLVWGARAIWGAVAYLGMKLFEFLAGGGTLR